MSLFMHDLASHELWNNHSQISKTRSNWQHTLKWGFLYSEKSPYYMLLFKMLLF